MSTPIGTYDQLVDWYEKGDLDFSQVRTVNLDEYRGWRRTNDQSYYYFMHEHLFDRVNIDPANTKRAGRNRAGTRKKECERYERLIESMGGVDIQLLGLGHNGHIGFNEPDASFAQKYTLCGSYREYDRGEQEIFRICGRCSETGVYNGHRNDHVAQRRSFSW